MDKGSEFRVASHHPIPSTVLFSFWTMLGSGVPGEYFRCLNASNSNYKIKSKIYWSNVMSSSRRKSSNNPCNNHWNIRSEVDVSAKCQHVGTFKFMCHLCAHILIDVGSGCC